MLSHADNETLTRTDAGTSMGDALRRYWIPALMTTEIPEPDGPPVRVKLLGEDLIRPALGRGHCASVSCGH